MSDLVRITGPDFVASLVPGERAAPKVAYMLHWSLDQIRAHCRSKRWGFEVARGRVFDHFTGGEPEDAWFSKVARAMQQESWWLTAPAWSEPQPVSGEIDERVHRRLQVELDRLQADGVSAAEVRRGLAEYIETRKAAP